MNTPLRLIQIGLLWLFSMAGIHALFNSYVWPAIGIEPSACMLTVWYPLTQGLLFATVMLAVTHGRYLWTKRKHPTSATPYVLETDAAALDALREGRLVSTQALKLMPGEGNGLEATLKSLTGRYPTLRYIETHREAGRVKLEGYLKKTRSPLLLSDGFDIRTHHALTQLLAA